MTTNLTQAEWRLLETVEIVRERLMSGKGMDWLYDYNLPDLAAAVEIVLAEDRQPSPTPRTIIDPTPSDPEWCNTCGGPCRYEGPIES